MSADRRQRERILKYQVKAFHARATADGLKVKIDVCQLSQKLDELMDSFGHDKTWILNFIANSSELFKDEWHRRLAGILITDDRADAELAGLLGEVRLWLRIAEGKPLLPPVLFKSPVQSPSPALETGWMERDWERDDLSWLGRLGRDREQRERKRELEREGRITELQLIESYLTGLIRLRDEYRSLTS